MIQKVDDHGNKIFACHNCKAYEIPAPLIVDGKCPECGDGGGLQPQCAEDHVCRCGNGEIHDTIKYCPNCGKPACPECGSHDCAQISRVTGYLQEVSGWNSGKRQELKDRQRYDALTGTQVIQ